MTDADLKRLSKAIPAGDAPAGVAYRLPGRRLAVCGGVVTKSVNAARMSIDSVLTTPGEDLAQDTVRPDGGDWRREFPRDPVVNWEHREPIARGGVPVLKSFDLGGGAAMLPVGTSYFAQRPADLDGLSLNARDGSGRVVGRYKVADCLDAADSAFRLVEADVATGVSIEFKPDGVEGVAYWPTGKKSLVERRDAYHWDRWVGLGWAHALRPVNPSARTIEGTLRADQVEKAFRIKETGRFPGGAPVSPIILKSFAGLVRPPRPTLVRVEKTVKEDDEDDTTDAPEGVDDVDPATGELEPGGGADTPADDRGAAAAVSGMTPTPDGFAFAIQHLLDGADALESKINAGQMEHVKGVERLQKHVEQLRADVEDLRADGVKMFPSAGLDNASGDGAAGVEQGDDGAALLKAFPAGYPVRFRLDAGGTYTRVEPAPADDTSGDTEMLRKAIADKKAELARREGRLARREERDAKLAAKNRARVHN